MQNPRSVCIAVLTLTLTARVIFLSPDRSWWGQAVVNDSVSKLNNTESFSITKAATKSFQLPEITNPKCLVFNHIPKSGGLAFSHYLLKDIASKTGWLYQSWYSFFEQRGDIDPVLHGNKAHSSTATLNTSIIHSGHYTPKFWNLTSTQNCFQVTLLREPVDRVISAFYYHGHTDDKWAICLEPHNNESNRCRFAIQYQDDMTRAFSAKSKAWNLYVERNYASTVSLDHLESAKKNLLKMNAICFLSELDACASRIAKRFGVEYKPISEDSKRINQGVRRRQVSPDVQTRIGAANSYDIALYEWAWNHFSMQREMGKGDISAES